MSAVFLTKSRKTSIPVHVLTKTSFKTWLAKQPALVKAKVKAVEFDGAPNKTVVLYDEKARVWGIMVGVHSPMKTYDLSYAADAATKAVSKTILESASFDLKFADKIGKGELETACIGWGLAAYQFHTYKKSKPTTAALVWPAKVDKKRVNAFVDAITLTRELINIPANDMGPDELEAATKKLAKQFEAKFSVIKDKALDDKNFPMIYAVGKGSPRRPRLLDFTWGNPKHKKVTLVGKGVCFDTGGLDIKPSKSMLQMKKDMGGSAHVLGLAHLIMALKLPVRLRILIPAVENSVSGESYRPWDILNSRKGITVEVGNTDAEGRLVLADALTYACEESPDLLIDCATLTGAQRIAMGFDIGAVLSNDDKVADEIKNISLALDDPLWPLPLWKPYRAEIDSANADISSTGGMAGTITAALFLQEFVTDKTTWVHTDIAAWEDRAKPGRSKGGNDMGVRALFAYIEKHYG